MNKEIPILFNGDMVRAILEGKKTQTRREVKAKIALQWLARDMFLPAFVADPENGLSPFGKPGDLLYVRETLHCDATGGARLELLKQAGEVIWYAFEPANLRLADKCFYRVDFLVLRSSGQLEAHECKGFWTDDARVKIKVAASLFPFRFVAVQLVKGAWKEEEF